MDNNMIETLISHGFTYEDLFKRGILTIAESSAEPPTAELPAAEPPAAEPTAAEPPAAEPPATEPPAGVTREDFDAFKNEIKTLLQSTITQAATRNGKTSDEPTLMDTIFDISERM